MAGLGQPCQHLRGDDVDVGMLGSVVGVGVGVEAEITAIDVFINYLYQQAVVVHVPVNPVSDSVCNLFF